MSDTVRRSPLIGQQGGSRPNARLSLADYIEYLNLKNDTVTHVYAQSCLKRSGHNFQCASYKKKISFREQTRKKLRTFSPFLEGETTLISADPVFPPITFLIYLCALVQSLHYGSKQDPRPCTNYQKKYRTTCNNMQHVICYLQRNFLKNIFFCMPL